MRWRTLGVAADEVDEQGVQGRHALESLFLFNLRVGLCDVTGCAVLALKLPVGRNRSCAPGEKTSNGVCSLASRSSPPEGLCAIAPYVSIIRYRTTRKRRREQDTEGMAFLRGTYASNTHTISRFACILCKIWWMSEVQLLRIRVALVVVVAAVILLC